MEKFYTRTDWENSPSTKTPINETNLNNIEEGVSELDDRVAELSHTKSNVDWVQLQQSGKKIAEVTIDGVKKNVYAPQSEGGGGGGTSDYTDLSNKPKINGVELNGNKTTSDLKINIPTALKDLADDSTHRLVTDAEKAEWNKPSGSDVEVEAILTSGTNIANITVDGNQVKLYAPTGGGGGGTDNYQLLENKPQINGVELNGNKTASDLGIIVPDVPSWALEPNKPSYTASEVGALPDTTTHLSGDVPTTRKVNGKALSSDITLNASDVNALPSNTTIPSALADLTEDATHRTVTDAEKAKWNQGGGSSVNVIDNLDSTSSTDALSANMGHSLNESLTQKQDSEDDALTTDSKTIVGGINELKQNLAQFNEIKTLWSGSIATNGIATLEDSVENYRILAIKYLIANSTSDGYKTFTFIRPSINQEFSEGFMLYASSNYYGATIVINFQTTTTMKFVKEYLRTYTAGRIVEIKGIK